MTATNHDDQRHKLVKFVYLSNDVKWVQLYSEKTVKTGEKLRSWVSLHHVFAQSVQCESKKIPPEDLWQYFQNGLEFFNQISHAYYAFLSTLDYEFLFKYLQVWRNYAILSMISW